MQSHHGVVSECLHPGTLPVEIDGQGRLHTRVRGQRRAERGFRDVRVRAVVARLVLRARVHGL